MVLFVDTDGEVNKFSGLLRNKDWMVNLLFVSLVENNENVN